MKKPLLTTQPDALVARLNELNEDKVETTSVGKINEMTDEELDSLRCGDVVVKKTGNQRHAYKVTYKEDKQGICLSYFDCGYTETVSYDYVDGHWVFNSKDVSMANQLEQIKDKDGHDRFIEGDITIEEIEGITQTYGKWSLSGTHLLIVVAYNIANNTTLAGQKLCSINVPQWILDKIVPLYLTAVNVIVTNGYSDDGVTLQSLTHALKKESSGLQINIASITTTAKRNFRIGFDLLIDNE